MDDTQTRLSKCFCAVFPQLSSQEIASATLGTVEGWDSVATVTLLTVIEEEFGVKFDLNELDHLASFRSILDYLTGLPAGD